MKPFNADALPPTTTEIVRPRGGLGNVLEKLQTGKPVTIAYFGGSITAGAGSSSDAKSYRGLMTQWLRNSFPQATITEVNAAIGGTGSDLGAFRLGHDVLRFKPDLAIVEYAVNDGGAPPQQIARSVEGIVRQIWRANARTDILFLYTLHEGMRSDYDKNVLPRSANVQDAIADYYGIPAINVAAPVFSLVRAGKWQIRPAKGADGKDLPVPEGITNFSNDGVHPLDAGYAEYARVIQDVAPAIAAASSPGEHALKPPVVADNWENAKLVPIDKQMLTGNWKQMDAADGLGKQFGNRMPAIWEATQPGSKLTFKFRGTTAKVYDLLGPDGAQVWVTVDGKKRDKPVARFDSYSSYHRLAAFHIADNLPPGEHTVEIEIDAQQPDRAIVTDKEKLKPNFDPKRYDGTAFRVGGLLLIGDVLLQ